MGFAPIIPDTRYSWFESCINPRIKAKDMIWELLFQLKNSYLEQKFVDL